MVSWRHGVMGGVIPSVAGAGERHYHICDVGGRHAAACRLAERSGKISVGPQVCSIEKDDERHVDARDVAPPGRTGIVDVLAMIG